MSEFRNIEAERARRGWTQEELCSRLDISQKTYWNWMHGKTSIQSAKIIRMCELFDVTSDYLLSLGESVRNEDEGTA
jgi:transcriptional regulator with XRE-family HTH domain